MFDLILDDDRAARREAPGFRAALRIRGTALDPDFITQQLGVAPTTRAQHAAEDDGGGAPAAHWEYVLQLPPGTELGDGLDLLLARVPNDATLWQELADAYAIDVCCEIPLATAGPTGAAPLHETTIDAAVLGRLAHVSLPLRLVFVAAEPDADADEPPTRGTAR